MKNINKTGRRDFLQFTGKWAAGCLIVPALLSGCRKEQGVRQSREETSSLPEPDADGFITLFNGETLEGWHQNPDRIAHGTGGRWRVEDGVITGEQDPPGSGNGGILLTDATFDEFELLIDMKPDWGIDSGLFLRANDQGQCFQMMVDYLDRGNVGQIYGEGVGAFSNSTFGISGSVDEAGRLTGLSANLRDGIEGTPEGEAATPEEWLDAWKLGEWNTVCVRCEGTIPTITTWINNVQISVFDADTFEHPNYKKDDVTEMLGTRGSIGVQVHGGDRWREGAKCRWKNIRIKIL